MTVESSTIATSSSSTTCDHVTPSSLPRLAPVNVVPLGLAHFSDVDEAVTFDATAASALGRVIAMEIHGNIQADGKTQYEVHVHLHATGSRIPIPVIPGLPVLRGLAKPHGQETTAPSVVVIRHDFGAFRRLRDAVYYAAHRGHTPGEGVSRACAFCAGTIDAVLQDHMQPHRYDEWIRETATVCSRLELFLWDLLVRASGSANNSASRMRRAALSARPRCGVQAHVQTLLAQFLQLDRLDDLP